MYKQNYSYLQKRDELRPTIETDDDEDTVVCELKFKGEEFTKLLKVPPL